MPRLLSGALLISFAPIWVRAAHLPLDLMAFYRMLFGALFILGAMVLFRPTRWQFPLRPRALLAGCAFALDLICWHRGILLLGPGLSTLIVNLQVLIVAGYGYVSGQNPPKRSFLFIAPFALLGLGCIVYASPLSRESLVLGVAFSLGAAVAYSVYLILLSKVESNENVDSRNTILQVSLAAALVTGVASVSQGQALWIPGIQALIYLMSYGIVIQGLAWFLIAGALKTVPAWQASLILLLQPILAMLWDVLFFARKLSPMELTGLCITLMAIQLNFLPELPWRKLKMTP